MPGGRYLQSRCKFLSEKHPRTGARGLEFTHKKFGEYLTAKALWRIAYEIAHEVARHPAKYLETALQQWLKASFGGELSFDLLTFLTG